MGTNRCMDRQQNRQTYGANATPTLVILNSLVEETRAVWLYIYRECCRMHEVRNMCLGYPLGLHVMCKIKLSKSGEKEEWKILVLVKHHSVF